MGEIFVNTKEICEKYKVSYDVAKRILDGQKKNVKHKGPKQVPLKYDKLQCKKCKHITEDVENYNSELSQHIIECYGKVRVPTKKEISLRDEPWHMEFFEGIIDVDNVVICEICQKEFKSLTNMHMRKKHNMSLGEYKKLYPHSIVTH